MSQSVKSWYETLTDKERNRLQMIPRRVNDIGEKSPMVSDDMVNHPSHYNRGGIEVFDVIEAYELDFLLGNSVKYILRAGKKDAGTYKQDLEKARANLDRKIASL